MGIRDEELKRLESYAKGLGVKITWKPYVPRSNIGGEWAVDGSEITLYTQKGKSKLYDILKFLHELAHHLAWVYQGRVTDLKTIQTLESEHGSFEFKKKKEKPAPKKERALIYKAEKDDAQYRFMIYKEVGLKFPLYKLETDVELDIWIYGQYYETGYFPSYKDVMIKKKELLQKNRSASGGK